jgi:hypothetical protein
MSFQRSLIALLVATTSTVALSADTLYLRNGTRVQGELVGVDSRVIQFEEDRGFGRRSVRDYDREDVLRIDLEPRRVTGVGPMVRPPGMRERLAIVTANVDWNDTNVEVRPGQEIYFEASGRVRWGRDRNDSAAGEPNSPANPNRPMPTRPAAALIGKIGRESTDVFFIGAETGPIRMRAGGRLLLGINDDFLPDNSGNFRVVIYY